MAAKFRNLLGSKCHQTVTALHREFEGTSRSLAASLRVRWDRREAVSLSQKTASLPIVSEQLLSEYVRMFPLDPAHGVEGVSLSSDSQTINFRLNKDKFVHEVLQNTSRRDMNYDWTRNALFEKEKKNVIVEFSSPNIAKPFHVGHLRSTILGNFVANVQERVGHRVTRINYLGDWGTQFGLLLAGLARSGLHLEEVLGGHQPVNRLLEVYIEANSLAEKDPAFFQEAREAFHKLENGDERCLEIWQQCRQVSVEDLDQSYSRLGVSFDHYHGESMYSGEKGKEVVELLREAGLLESLEDGREVVRGPEDRVTVTKSDGTGLYISRDIAAALDRMQSFHFDRMFYVVDNAQEKHFKNLFHILESLGHGWGGDCRHVRFGKIQGMSTRRGSMVYVSELLEQAKAIMLQGQEESRNTKLSQGEGEFTAEAMAVSALVVHDLSKRRTKDYKFSWTNALSSRGDTGIKLQYTHARLTSILSTCWPLLDHEPEVVSSLLTEPEATHLVVLLASWDEVLATCATTLEPHSLTHYLFKLANGASKAVKALQVKPLVTSDPETARARLLLFSCVRKVLAEGMTVLGVTPLDRL